MLTVPAFPFLWSAHDRTHHHYRRYTRRSLVDKINAAGYEPEYVTYFNFLLFPIIAATRFLKNWLALNDTADERMPAQLVNFLLRSVFSAERHWIGRVTMPFGVSLLVVATNPR